MPMQPTKTWTRIEGHITAAVESHEAFKTAMTSAIHHALKCGWELCQAKAILPHGTWSRFLEEHVPFSERTAQRYCQFTGMTMVRLGQRDPKLLNGLRIPTQMRPDKTVEVDLDQVGRRADLYEVIQKAALESPVELVALAREVGLLRPFEESAGRARSHAAHDHSAPERQLIFSFDEVRGAIRGCLRLPKLSGELRPPPGQLLGLRNDLVKALACVEKAIADGGVVDILADGAAATVAAATETPEDQAL